MIEIVTPFLFDYSVDKEEAKTTILLVLIFPDKSWRKKSQITNRKISGTMNL